jgi:WD40 repeat protein
VAILAIAPIEEDGALRARLDSSNWFPSMRSWRRNLNPLSRTLRGKPDLRRPECDRIPARSARSSSTLECFRWVLAAWCCALVGLPESALAQPVFTGMIGREIRIPGCERLGRAPVITSVRLQPGGTRLAVAGDDHLVSIWDLAEDRLVHQLRGHQDWVLALAFSPDGRVLVSAGSDRRVIFWDASSGDRLGFLEVLPCAVTQLSFNHRGDLLAVTGFECGVRIYDVVNRRLIRKLEGSSSDLRALAFSPDDRWIAVGGRDGRISVWQTDSGKLVTDYAAHRQRIRDLAFSPEGNRLVSCGEDRRIHVRLLDESRGFDLPPSPGKVYALVFCSPTSLATGGSDNVVRLWDLTQRKQVGELRDHHGSIAALASNGDILVSGGFDTTIRIWELQGRVAEVPRRGHERQ